MGESARLGPTATRGMRGRCDDIYRATAGGPEGRQAPTPEPSNCIPNPPAVVLMATDGNVPHLPPSCVFVGTGYDFVRLGTCWSPTVHRITSGLSSPTIQECADWTAATARCSDYFTLDPGNNNWCGCGVANTANAQCNEDGGVAHDSSRVYQLRNGEFFP